MPIEASPAVSYYGQRTGTEARVPQRTLGQQDFLKLLVAQMQQQDPLNPKADIDFIAQMAQFSSLEQNRSMQSSMTLLQANSLLGRTVTLEHEGQSVVGVVSAVQIEEGMPQLVVGGRNYELKEVQGIEPAPAAAPAAAAASASAPAPA